MTDSRTETVPTGEADLRLQLPAYEDFIDGTVVVARMKEINRFTYTVQYEPHNALTSGALAETVLAACVESLGNILPETGIHYLHGLRANLQRPDPERAPLDTDKPIVNVALAESRNHFSVNMYDDRLTITRDSSSFADFYNWYRLFMPNAYHAETSIRRALEAAQGRPLRVVQTQYDFKFFFSDFQSTGRKMRSGHTRNVDVLQTIIPALPDQAGLTELSKQQFYRLDLKLSRLEEFVLAGKNSKRNCWYIIEAPFNENGRFLAVTAQLRNSSFESLAAPDDQEQSVMVPFDEDFADDYYLAILNFLRDRACEGFMARLLENWNFATQRQL